MKICEIIREEYISSRVPAAGGYLTEDEIRVLRENPKILQEWIGPALRGGAMAATLIAKYGKKAYEAAKKYFTKKKENEQSKDLVVTPKQRLPGNDNLWSDPGAGQDLPLELQSWLDEPPSSMSAIKYKHALKGQKITKFDKTGNVEHLRGLSVTEVYGTVAKRAGDAAAKKALDTLFKGKP